VDATAAAAVNALSVCVSCRNYRMRPTAQLFSQADLQVPGVLKSSIEAEQQADERRRLEMQRLQANQAFTYEPFYYPWCAAATPFDPTAVAKAQDAGAAGDRAAARKIAKDRVAEICDLRKKAKAGEPVVNQLLDTGAMVTDPVSGDLVPVYGLCAVINQDGQCPMFDPGDRAELQRTRNLPVCAPQ
jgi:hypothetical protein